MIRLRLGLFLIFAISSSLGQNQDLIDENSLDLALRNVIQYIESGSNSLFAYKVGHVETMLSEDDTDGNQFTVHVNTLTTFCRKGVHYSELDNCPINPDEPVMDCQLSVYREFLNGEEDFETPPAYSFGQISCNIPEEPRFNFQSVPLDAITSEQFPKLKSNAESIRDLKKLQSHHTFKEFMRAHNKDYPNFEEYQKRFGVFKENMQKVQFLRETERGTGVYGGTKFADLTAEEFKERHLGLYTKAYDPVENQFDSDLPDADIPDIDLPAKYDWREQGAVTPVKNQGACGSCWAFSVTGNVEGQYKIHHGKLLSFSEQELVDCDKLDSGCNGGLPENAYEAISKLGGLELEEEYVYDGQDDQCSFNKSLVKVQVTGGVKISTNETEMAQWLLKNGPISIGINANAMQFYMGGVSHPWKFLCSPASLDHGVLIVGFGIHHYPMFRKDMPFWIVKNSWGPGWGEQGYYRVYRGDGTCGVNQMATSSVIV